MQIQQTVGDPKKLLENISYNMKEFSKKIQSMTFEKKGGTTGIAMPLTRQTPGTSTFF